jgi:hypothetical protein
VTTLKKKKLPIFLTIITCLTFSVVPAYAAPTGDTQLFLSTATGPLASYSDIYGDQSYNQLKIVHKVIKDNGSPPLFQQSYSNTNITNLSSGVQYHTWDPDSNYRAEGSFEAIQNGVTVWSHSDVDNTL